MHIIDVLVALLKVPETRRLEKYIDRIVKLNQEADQTTNQGFLYRGLRYWHSSVPNGNIPMKALHDSLCHEIEDYLASELAVKNELQLVGQSLRALLQKCQSTQDVRDALPECLVQILDRKISSLPRERPEAWTLEPGSRAERQYRKILPRIEFFTAARLLY